MRITGPAIYTENGWIENGSVKITNEKISAMDEMIINKDGEDLFDFPSDYKCLPGMIDVHIHGAGGSDTMDASPEALSNIAQTLPKEATTGFLATTITQEPAAIEKAIKNAGDYIKNQPSGQAEILGIHLEGPFLNQEKAGAQPPEYILDGDLDLFEAWQKLSGDNIKLVTVAPEIKNGLKLINYLSVHGVVASIGHSNGGFRDVANAVEAGATHVTHLFNGMSGLHHREPGVVGGALLHDELYAEMIVDGIHICPETVDLAYRQKGPGKTILITDAMRAKCMKNGTYDLGGQEVTVTDGKAVLASGSLAGSVLKMDQAMQNMMAFTAAKLEDIVEMGSVNPAMQCGVYDRKGSITRGKDADLIILDDNNQLVMTICRGVVTYRQEER
ncbi:N-acetylglucosamine 6-phosphate deacetylase [Scopulibacillus darangshiensis]|uniref:N-acetylglucosamine-6-phosphate deacetylase n=1 Tax=Scopulibacillus darangshiensis TaxID=442528 RepID=A0A4R2P7G0_9BACL|nr:N-acetylglucosamine-6-phosphate deacetylase [Scopulibacillus darangshiensis]TCP30198.1 N-acetylglucosamine 6-phosphate deacetylase [Scopulibacillus darangshiensis]